MPPRRPASVDMVDIMNRCQRCHGNGEIPVYIHNWDKGTTELTSYTVCTLCDGTGQTDKCAACDGDGEDCDIRWAPGGVKDLLCTPCLVCRTTGLAVREAA